VAGVPHTDREVTRADRALRRPPGRGRAGPTGRDHKLGELTMRHARLAALTFAVTLATAACSGTSSLLNPLLDEGDRHGPLSS
jgi:hypothetical protein